MAPSKQPDRTIPLPIIPMLPPLPVPVPNLPKLPGPLHTINDVGSFLGALSNPNTWIRVAEFGVGVILIAVGIGAMLRIDVQGSVKQGAKAAALL